MNRSAVFLCATLACCCALFLPQSLAVRVYNPKELNFIFSEREKISRFVNKQFFNRNSRKKHAGDLFCVFCVAADLEASE